MSEYPEQDLEEESNISLATQLGSDAKTLGLGKIDMKILTVLEDKHKTPNTMKPALYWTTYVDVIFNGKNTAEALVDNLFKLNVSARGRGRRDLLRAEEVRKGGQANVESEIEKPGWIERNITRRNWEQEEREKLGLT